MCSFGTLFGSLQCMNRMKSSRRPHHPPRTCPTSRSHATEGQLVEWAVAHYRATGRWPDPTSSVVVPEASDRTWLGISLGLQRLGTTREELVDLFAIHSHIDGTLLPPLTPERILDWVGEYLHRQGRLPTRVSGALSFAPGEDWMGIDRCLKHGLRGLSGNSSLRLLVVERRLLAGRSGRKSISLTVPMIRQWASAFKHRHSEWPTKKSGPIREAPGHSWLGVDRALYLGRYGLPVCGGLLSILET